jgi:ABC-type polysaccharide/polyol phosphate transport system ATPase subunit
VRAANGSIRFADVRKVYRWRGRRRRGETLKGAFFQRGRGRHGRTTEEHVALDGVNLLVDPGEAVAIIGPNGSGKSTFLKLAGGILRPTQGEVEVGGRVTALIELGAGFHPEITGRENVLINGMLLGLTRSEVEERMPAIIEFADIGDFIEQPVKTYSSGMYVRLGFAVAVSADPDILLIDEVLAVGDRAFTRRCLDRLARMRQRGVTMVLVSHDLDLVTSFADRALYLEGGRQIAVGPVDAVVARYRSDAADDGPGTAQTAAPAVRVIEDGRRWGNGDVEIVEVEALAGGSPQRLLPRGEPCRLRIRYRVHRPVEDFVFGVAWHRPDGTLVSGHNTELGGLAPKLLAGDGEVTCVYDALELAPGEYRLDVAVHAQEGLAYDYWCDALRIRVTSEVEWPGVWSPSHRWESSGPEWRSK